MKNFAIKKLLILIFVIFTAHACDIPLITQGIEQISQLDCKEAISLYREALLLLCQDAYSITARQKIKEAADRQHPNAKRLLTIFNIWNLVIEGVDESKSKRGNTPKLNDAVAKLAQQFCVYYKDNNLEFKEIIEYIFLNEISNKLSDHQFEQLKLNLIDHSIDGFHCVLAYINESQSSISTALMDKIILATEQYTKQHPQELFINKTEKTCQALMVYHFVKTKTCIKEMVDKNDFTDLEPCLENLGNLILISKDAKDLYLQTKCEELIEGAEKKLKTARLPRQSKANIHSTLANMQIYFGNIQKALDILEDNHDLPSSKFTLGALLLQTKSKDIERKDIERAISLIEDAALADDKNAIVFIANKFCLFKAYGQINQEIIIKRLTSEIAKAEKQSMTETHKKEIVSINNPELRKLKCALGLFVMEHQCWVNPKNKVTASQAKQLLIEASLCSTEQLSCREILAKTNLAKLLMNEGNFSECQSIIDEMTNPELPQNIQVDFRDMQIELNLRKSPGFKYYDDAKINASLKHRADAMTNLACAEKHNFPNTFMLKWLWKVQGFVEITQCQEIDETLKIQLLLAQLIPAAKKTKDLLTEQNMTINEDLDKMILMAEENVEHFSLKLTDQKSQDLIAKAKGQLAILKK